MLGTEEPVHQVLEAVGLLDDDPGVLLLILIELPLEELRRAAEPGERVLDLVGELPDEEPRGLLLGVLVDLVRDAPPAVDLVHLHKREGLLALALEAVHHDVDGVLAAFRDDEDLALVEAAARDDVILHSFEDYAAFPDDPPELGPCRMEHADAEHLLGGRIEIFDSEIPIYENDRC